MKISQEPDGPLHVHLLHEPQDPHLEDLNHQLLPGIRITTGETVAPDAEILVAGRPDETQIAASPRLRSLLIPFAGLPAVTRQRMQDFPHIAVHNLHHNAPMTAEMALALLMATARRLIPADRIFRSHDWSPRYGGFEANILDGKTALILGYGAIGQRLGAICSVLGMRILAIRRRPQPDSVAEVFAPDVLHDLLPQAHVLLVCLPGTPDTTGMIGESEIARMPHDAIIVNIGRASVIDPAALYNALRNGHLYGAGLDVWYNYPTDVESRQHTPPADYPFHELDNVVMSPHRAGGGGAFEVEVRRIRALAHSLNAAARGDPMPNRVDLQEGY